MTTDSINQVDSPTTSSSSAPRAILISPGFPPTVGGVESHVGRLAMGLAHSGFKVDVHAGSVRPHQPPIIGDAPDSLSVTLAKAFTVLSLSASPQLIWRAWRLRGERDLIHVHSYHSLSGLAVAVIGDGPVVFTPHYHGGGHTGLARVLHIPYRWVGRYIFARADVVICVSEAERQRVHRDFPVTVSKTVVIPNSVAAESIRSAKPFDTTTPVIVTAGRLEEYKRIDRLVESFATMSIPARLVIIGDGPDRHRLEQVAATHGVADQVEFTGPIPTTDVHRWLNTARVVVSLSEHEAFGLVALEGAVAGAHVVLSDIAAHREVSDRYLGGAATLVDANDIDSLTTVLESLTSRGVRACPTDIPDEHSVAAETVNAYTTARRRAGRRGRRTREGHPVSILDRPWAGHQVAVVAGPAQMAPTAAVRATFTEFMRANPDNPIACTLDAGGSRWRPVPAEERESHVRKAITRRTDPLPDGDHHRVLEVVLGDDLPSHLPFRVTVWGDWFVIVAQHCLADGASASLLTLALSLNQVEVLAALTRRISMRDALHALPRSASGNLANWTTYAASMRQRHRRLAAHMVHHEAPADSGQRRPRVIGTSLELSALAELKELRRQHFPEVSMSSLLAALLFRALSDEGVDMYPEGMYALVDARRTLFTDNTFAVGNGAKSIFIEADMTDPKAIDSQVKRSIATARAIPGILFGASMSANPKPATEPSVRLDTRLLTVSMMMHLPHLDHSSGIPWREGHTPHMTGVGLGPLANSINVFSVRAGDRLEISTALDAGDPEFAAIASAFTRLHHPRRVFDSDAP